MPIKDPEIVESTLWKGRNEALGQVNAPAILTRISQTVQTSALPRRRFLPFDFLKVYKNWRLKRSVGPQALSDFFDHLATLLTSGIPLLQALEFIRSATRHPALRQSLEFISARIRSGARFSEALREHPDIFDQVVLGMVKAAEASGQLETVSRELARAFAQKAETRSRLLQAFAYPALVTCFGVITVLALMIFVIPQLATVFELWEMPLPLVTRWILGISSFLSHGGFFLLFLLGISGLVYLRSLGTEKRRQVGYRAISKIPFLKRLLFLTDFVRLCRTWAMLLRSGVPLIKAIHSSRGVLWDPKIGSQLDSVREKIVRGSALEEAMREETWFPELALNFLAIGGQTGTLDESFEKIAAFYEREFDRKMKLMGTFLEPMMILAIGLVVGFLVISLLLPIFEMSLVVR